MNKLHELGTGWTIKGGVATRGNVAVAEMQHPSIYRASFGDFTASDYNSPLVALASLRRVLARHMQRAESALDDMAEALAAIDAPAPPETECEHKTSVLWRSISRVGYLAELNVCQWDCHEIFVTVKLVGDFSTREMSLAEAGCPFGSEQPSEVATWFDDEFEVTA